MLAGIGLIAVAVVAEAGVPADLPAVDPLGACPPFAGGAEAVDPLVEVAGEEDAGGAPRRHDGNATKVANTSKYGALIGVHVSDKLSSAHH
jgi:hypothetical protein